MNLKMGKYLSQSIEIFVLIGDDPSEMDDESLNGDKSILSMEEDASGAGSPSPSPWPEHPTQSIKEETHPEETTVAVAATATSTEESETTNDVHSTSLKRRRPADGSHSRGSESSESGVGGVGGIDASLHPAAALVTSQPNLLSADLLQSLQYFALLRQSLPANGSYIKFYELLVYFVCQIEQFHTCCCCPMMGEMQLERLHSNPFQFPTQSKISDE